MMGEIAITLRDVDEQEIAGLIRYEVKADSLGNERLTMRASVAHHNVSKL